VLLARISSLILAKNEGKSLFLDRQLRTAPHSLATCNMALGTVLTSVQRVYVLKRRADLSFRRCSSTFLAKGTAGAREGTGLLSEKKALLKII